MLLLTAIVAVVFTLVAVANASLARPQGRYELGAGSGRRPIARELR